MIDWRDLHYVGFDLETTGIDVENDRIVTSSLVYAAPGAKPAITKLLCNPGIEIPAGAAKVHGISTEHAREHGQPPVPVINRTQQILSKAVDSCWPIVGMNLAYDFTLLDREARRNSIAPLADIHDFTGIFPVIDILVIDRAMRPMNKFGAGKRKLENLCELYGVVHEGAHDSTHDVIASMRVFWKMLAKYPELRDMESLSALHRRQTDWKAEQARFLQVVCKFKDAAPEWPVLPLPAPPVVKWPRKPEVSYDEYQDSLERQAERVKDCRDPWCTEKPETTCGRTPAMHFVTNPELTQDLLTGNFDHDVAVAPKVKEAVRDALTEYPELVAERHAIALFAERFDIDVIGIVEEI